MVVGRARKSGVGKQKARRMDIEAGLARTEACEGRNRNKCKDMIRVRCVRFGNREYRVPHGNVLTGGVIRCKADRYIFVRGTVSYWAQCVELH